MENGLNNSNLWFVYSKNMSYRNAVNIYSLDNFAVHIHQILTVYVWEKYVSSSFDFFDLE
jgi:hypothetical protein